MNAALRLIREKGYGATTVDELCAAAGVTKGAFFHHFKSKEALGVAAAQYWSQMTGGLFAGAPYHQPADPLARLLAYIDFRSELIDGPVEGFTFLVGTKVLNAILLVPLLIAMVGLGRDRELMGPFASSRAATAVYGITTAVVVACVVTLGISTVLG